MSKIILTKNRTRICTKCFKELPASIEYFSFRKNYGLRRDCRKCESARAKEYREKNKERLKQNRNERKK